ncbi:MAG: allophanate hydrolase subunit 1 [Aquabacterium sp.]|nr:allophanate hydrolase subunit 1 [Aquabacterium sp.]
MSREGDANAQGQWPRFTPVADHALLVSFGDAISDATSARVVALDRALAAAPPPGFGECVPALVNLLITFDPLQTDHDQVQVHVAQLLLSPAHRAAAGRTHQIEVCYDADFAPDLPAVALAAGLSIAHTIDCHLQADYAVRMYGFAPGYAYLSGVPAAIQVPRKPAAMRDISAGSVVIAGPQCLVTTLTMPTGWSIIGRSPTRIFTPDSDAPFLFDVGDQVRFRRIDRDQFEAARVRLAAGDRRHG